MPVVMMRGGTSKGVFVRENVLPPPGTARDEFLLSLMGTPDPMQLDGLGGTHSSTSKVMAISPSERPDSDVDYLFVQVGVDRPIVDYAGNCGNLTAAVGAYAVDEALVPAVEPVTVVRLFNKNTGRRVLAHVQVAGGRAVITGDTVVSGVPGTGAPLVTEYLDPAGSVTGSLLPTGHGVDTLRPAVGARMEVSIVDVSTPVVFVRARDVGLEPHVTAHEINSNTEILARLESIRAAAAVALGFAADEQQASVDSAILPRVLLVDAAHTHALSDGRTLDARDHDLIVRAISMQQAHHSCPMTVALCAAAATKIPGTVPNAATGATNSPTVRIAHPKGIASVDVSITPDDELASVSVIRTARRLLAGAAYVRLS